MAASIGRGMHPQLPFRCYFITSYDWLLPARLLHSMTVVSLTQTRYANTSTLMAMAIS